MEYIDPTAVSPMHYKTLFENDMVRVLGMDLPAGQSDEMHSHPSETVYFLSGGQARVHMPDGEAADVEFPDGHVMWHEPWTHRVENVGDTDIHAVIVESKT